MCATIHVQYRRAMACLSPLYAIDPQVVLWVVVEKGCPSSSGDFTSIFQFPFYKWLLVEAALADLVRR